MNIISKLSLIFKFVFDKKIPLKNKWWILIPAIYILSPVDLIPAPIFGFSVVDDIIMLAYLLSIVNDKAKKYDYNEQDYSKFSGQNIFNKFKKNPNEEIIEGVQYKVEEDDEKK